MHKFTLDVIEKLDFTSEIDLFKQVIGNNEEELYTLAYNYVLSKHPQEEIISKESATELIQKINQTLSSFEIAVLA